MDLEQRVELLEELVEELFDNSDIAHRRYYISNRHFVVAEKKKAETPVKESRPGYGCPGCSDCGA
jgi:CRISPR/Cas system-associated protein Cas7 (RAMP superfamily)